MKANSIRIHSCNTWGKVHSLSVLLSVLKRPLLQNSQYPSFTTLQGAKLQLLTILEHYRHAARSWGGDTDRTEGKVKHIEAGTHLIGARAEYSRTATAFQSPLLRHAKRLALHVDVPHNFHMSDPAAPQMRQLAPFCSWGLDYPVARFCPHHDLPSSG